MYNEWTQYLTRPSSGFPFSLCRAKKPVNLPDYHFIDHRIEITEHSKDYNKVALYSAAVARPSPLPKKVA